jgi:ribosomal protein RSM22 (predicted rRNA methylase)
LAERQPSKLNVAGSNPVSRSNDPSPTAAAPSDRATEIASAGRRLRDAIARAIRVDPGLATAAAELSAGYRSGALLPVRGGRLHDPRMAAAYAAARMPATFAAAGRSLAEAADATPGFAPQSHLDVGAGTGATAWAAAAVWPAIGTTRLIDVAPAAMDLGRVLAAEHGLATADWRLADALIEPLPQSDLVTAAYVLGELDEEARAALVARLWAATGGLIVVVEPGSPAGFERIRTARADLIGAGGHVVAPCPGDLPCPIADRAWCHFLVRLDRSELQRRAKTAPRSWEDEPFSYVAAARPDVAARPRPRVVLGRPRRRPGIVELRVCVDGRIQTSVVSRRGGPAWRAAKALEWGDPVPAGIVEAR